MTLLKQDPSAQRPCAKTMLGLPGIGHLQAELVARSRLVARAGPYAGCAPCGTALRATRPWEPPPGLTSGAIRPAHARGTRKWKNRVSCITLMAHTPRASSASGFRSPRLAVARFRRSHPRAPSTPQRYGLRSELRDLSRARRLEPSRLRRRDAASEPAIHTWSNARGPSPWEV